VGLVQLLTPLTLCYGLQDKRRSTQIWIGAYCVLVLLSVFCFVLGLVYQIDNRKVFHQTNTYGNKYIHNYAYYGGSSGYNSGRQYVGDSYDTSWWKYEKGQAYLGVLGCDVFVILFVLGWMIRRLCVMKDDDDGGKYSHKKYKYEPQYDRGSSASPVSHHSQFERTSQVYHVQPPKQDRSPSPMHQYQGPPPRQERTPSPMQQYQGPPPRQERSSPSPMYQYQGPPPRQEMRRSPSPMLYQYQGPPVRQERSSPV